MRSKEKTPVFKGRKGQLLARADALFGVPCMPVPQAPEKPTPGDSPAGTLAGLQAEVEASFPGCDSLATATNCVFGEGNDHADLVFVGEAPGAEEDRLGRPFVGPAGQKLDDIIAAMGFAREDVYICNVLKARPPGNRNPLPDEVTMSLPWLERQLRLIRPRVIVALGGPATKTLLRTDEGITRLRGQWSAWRDPLTGDETPVMPTFHPAYLLRTYTPEVRGQVWQDMQAVLAALGRS